MDSKQLYAQYKGLQGAKTPQAQAQRRDLVGQIASARRAEKGIGQYAEPINPMAPGKFAEPLRPPVGGARPQVPDIGARPTPIGQPPISVTGPIDLTRIAPNPNLNQDKYGAGMMPPRSEDYPIVPPRSTDYPIVPPRSTDYPTAVPRSTDYPTAQREAALAAFMQRLANRFYRGA